MLEVKVALIGPGLIGSALLRQIYSQKNAIPSLVDAKIRIVAVANSKAMLIGSHSGLGEEAQTKDQDLWRMQLSDQDSLPFSWPQLLEVLAPRDAPDACSVLVDCTASDAIPELYEKAISRGCHVVTPNKRFGAGPVSRYEYVLALAAARRRSFMYEATVGAGLPLISTIRSLLETGDRVIKVEGILSGTLSFIFNTYRPPATPFSEVVREAKRLGYTEPDPREDLSGQDVGRKVCILARTLGLPLEMQDLQIESLVPEPLRDLPAVQQYLDELPKYDAEIAQKAADAAARGEVIRYVGSVHIDSSSYEAAADGGAVLPFKGSASVRLASFPTAHPFAQLAGADNVLVITSERYGGRLGSTPLVVRGPGAGAEVTAAGVFSDILQIIRSHKSNWV